VRERRVRVARLVEADRLVLRDDGRQVAAELDARAGKRLAGLPRLPFALHREQVAQHRGIEPAPRHRRTDERMHLLRVDVLGLDVDELRCV
jgi:hypothetical protein